MCHMKLGDPAKAKEYFDRAEQWAKDRKDISPMNAVELKVFRSEAEALLKSGVPSKPPSGGNKP